MADHFYSAEEAAEVLGLQVRTVRNYVRDGRLPGARIGKQYRIARADLEAFAGGGADRTGRPAAPEAVPRRIDVTSVIELDPIDQEAADRVIRTLDAVIAARSEEAATVRVEPLYDARRSRLKLIVVAEAKDAADIIRLVLAVG
jgi:excisionase family DNA binding protein